ncbi:MAG: WG repeat-containing protein [Sandaracinus sp.]|nr:WG repeat-containing protein [Sandaracinus sp.]
MKREGKWTWIDPSGREIAPPRWDGVGVFGKDGVAVVREGVRFGLVDREARELVSPRFGALGAMSYGLSRAQALDETKPHAPPATWAALPAEGSRSRASRVRIETRSFASSSASRRRPTKRRSRRRHAS